MLDKRKVAEQYLRTNIASHIVFFATVVCIKNQLFYSKYKIAEI